TTPVSIKANAGVFASETSSSAGAHFEPGPVFMGRRTSRTSAGQIRWRTGGRTVSLLSRGNGSLTETGTLHKKTLPHDNYSGRLGPVSGNMKLLLSEDLSYSFLFRSFFVS
ncbi:MAG TPA: hypothetical protein PLA90_14090, partial [Candidatus Sumerlaeota bacterium]|nr:hypothetical protein [Candidatus Sumerlaeota bacterium]